MKAQLIIIGSTIVRGMTITGQHQKLKKEPLLYRSEKTAGFISIQLRLFAS